MRYLRLVSYLMTIVGLVLTVCAVLFDLGGALTLTGMMLVVAGLVKIASLAIWNGFAGLGPIKTTDDA